MNETTTIKSLIDHCLREVARPNTKRSFEHYVFLECLKNLSEEDFARIKEQYNYIAEE